MESLVAALTVGPFRAPFCPRVINLCPEEFTRSRASRSAPTTSSSQKPSRRATPYAVLRGSSQRPTLTLFRWSTRGSHEIFIYHVNIILMSSLREKKLALERATTYLELTLVEDPHQNVGA